MTAIRGIDISGWQHDDPNHPGIDFESVKQDGYRFVIIKSTQGVTYQNEHFAADFEAAKSAGLLVGAYHYAWPTQAGGEEEAKYALAFTAAHELDLGVTLDLETYGELPPGSDLQNYATQFLRLISLEHEDAPQYSYLSFFGSMGGPVPNHKIWIAPLAEGEEYPAHWPRPWMEQRAAGPVAGISGDVDLDEVMSPRGIDPPGKPKPEPEKPAEAPIEVEAETTEG